VKRVLLGVLLFALMVAVLSVSGLTAEDSIELFNGKDLAGWQAYFSEPGAKMEDVWSVKDGLLVCKGRPTGYLYTKREFTSYLLVVEWRWAPGTEPGNSGVLLRINGEPKTLPRSIEAQLKSGDAGDLYGFHGLKIDGDRARTSHQTSSGTGELVGVKKITGAEKAPGEWNRYEIRLDGGALQVKVNGTLVNEAKDCEVLSGPIGLQSEGGEIHFRTVELSPL
jgi:hypothetical protein